MFAFAAILCLLVAAPAARAAPDGGRAAAARPLGGGDSAALSFASLSGVSADSATDAWTVGSYYNTTTGTDHTLIVHWNGTSWSKAKSPSPGAGVFDQLTGVSADSPTDAWAVGSYCASGCGGASEVDHTLIVHWNGARWSTVKSPSPGAGGFELLNGVSADSPTDAWAAGFYCASGCGGASEVDDTLILHWNGASWSKVKSPNPGAGSFRLLNGVSADSPTDAWAAGMYCTTGSCAVQDSLILHWNGTSWSKVNSPNPGSGDLNQLNGVSADSPTDAWAAGIEGTATGTVTLILHWNGASWSKVKSPNPGSTTSPNDQLRGVSADSATDAWAAGYYYNTTTGTNDTLILHWNGTSWAKVKSPNHSSTVSNVLNGVSADSPADAWAAGEYCPPQKCTVPTTLILHWNGTAWTQS